MSIDIPTILILETFASVLAAAVLATARDSEPGSGLTEARAAMVTLTPAFALQFARGSAVEGPAIVGANVLFWLSSALVYGCYARFAGAPRLPRWPFAVVALAAPLFALLWVAGAPYGLRACVTSVIIATPLTACLYELARDGGFGREPSRRVAFTLTAFVVVPMWLRVLVLLPRLGDELNPLKSSLESALGFFPPIVLVQGFALSFLMMQRERSEARAKKQAVTDPLTDCLNRRALEERVRGELAYTQRTRRPFALLVIDLDYFKRINDEHGHAAGDAVLVHTAQALRALVRPSDVVARYGGEEFCLLLRDTESAGAAAVASRICSTLRAHAVEFAGARIPISASIGVAATDPAGGESWDALFHRTDAALYRAKQAGRDRVELAEPPYSPAMSALSALPAAS